MIKLWSINLYCENPQLTERNGEQCGKKENEKKSSYEKASIEVSRCLYTTV